jgi:hypothetical protein
LLNKKKEVITMAEDISKKTLAVLLVVAIAISFLGTWVALSQSPDNINLGGGSGQNIVNHPVDSGRVSFHIGPLPGTIDTGNVGLKIIR